MRDLSTALLALSSALMAFMPLQAQAPQTFSVGNITVEAGQKASGFLEVPDGVDEGTRIPITVVHGSTPGPVLALLAANHGTEYISVFALQRVGKDLDPFALSGTVIIVHIVSVPSFLGRSVVNPVDRKNLNRVYPGNRDGTSSERIAYAVTTEVISQADYMVDMHAGEAHESTVAWTYETVTGDPALDEGTRGMARAWGGDVIVVYEHGPATASRGWSKTESLMRGIPALAVARGDQHRNHPAEIEVTERSVWNLLRHLDMVDGEARRQGAALRVEECSVRSPADGIFIPAIYAGQEIEEGALLGTLKDFFGNTIEEFLSPCTGVVVDFIAAPPIKEGDTAVNLGRIID